MTPRNYKIVFMGTPEFAVPSLQALISDDRFEVAAVVTQPDRPAGRKQELRTSPIKQLAEANSIPVLQPEKVKGNAELMQQLEDMNLDTIVVVAYGKILPQELLDIPRMGVVNVHGSLLPKYRGASPISEVILNGDAETGVTLMKLVLEMDAGPMIATSIPTPITDEDTTASVSERLSQDGAKLLIDKLPGYLDGEIKPVAQDDARATYTKLVKKEDGLIDWSADEEVIARQVRAYHPWPSAQTALNDTPAKILEVGLAQDSDNPRGQIAKIDGQMQIGRLVIKKLQLAGKNPVSGKEFLAGHSDMIGTSML